MGPKKDKVWLEFKIIEGQCDGTGKKKKTVLCKYCNVSYSFPNATRMNGHLAYQCLICPEDIKQRAIDSLKKASKNKKRKHSESDRSDIIIIDDPQAESDKHSGSGASSSSNGNQVVSHRHSVMSSQSSIISFVEKTPLEKKKKIDELLARAMYVTSAPLNMFSNPYWQAAFHELRSSYSLPTPYEFGTPLLNAEYSRVMTSASNKLKSAVCLGLMTDGWSNVRAEGIVNFLISTPAIVFIKNVNPGQKRENSAFISRELIQIIEDCETNYDINPKKFFILITDNAAVMKAAWCLVLEKFPHICAVACSAHSFNLLLNDIMKQPSLSSFYKQVKSVIKTVKKKTVVLATSQSKQADQGITVNLKLPPTTRWCYIVICLESLLVNKSALQQTVICEQLKDCIPRDVRSNVLDDEEFWNTVKIVHDFLAPLHTAIKKVEGDTAILSLVPEVTSNVRKSMQDLLPSTPLDHNEQEVVQKAITERLYHCNLDVHFAANLLDPRFKGKKLDSFEIHSAMDFINKQCIHLGLDKASLMADLAAYRTGTGFYQREYLWESANSLQPTVWWGGLCASQPLEPLASRLLSVPPTSAGCERDWSIQGSIHTKKRNRLKNERVEKLKAIKQNVQYTANALLPKKVKNLNPNVESASDVSLDKEHRNLNLELPLSDNDWSDWSASDSETSEYTSDD